MTVLFLGLPLWLWLLIAAGIALIGVFAVFARRWSRNIARVVRSASELVAAITEEESLR